MRSKMGCLIEAKQIKKGLLHLGINEKRAMMSKIT